MSTKPKKPAQSRHKLSFAVDRDEIEINSDWVEAVMGPPLPQEPAFFSPKEKTATVCESATAEVFATGPVADLATAEHDATVEAITPVKDSATGVGEDPAAAPAASCAPDDHVATVEGFSEAPTPRRRLPRPRPIRSITDGLTPGQYTVYSLMYAQGQDDLDAESRLYAGGYADLCRLAGLSKRGIQNVIAELQAKSIIAIHRAPGYHRAQTSVYRVLSPDRALALWRQLGLRFALGKSKRLTTSATVAVFAIA
jgi:hypothetical protein